MNLVACAWTQPAAAVACAAASVVAPSLACLGWAGALLLKRCALEAASSCYAASASLSLWYLSCVGWVFLQISVQSNGSHELSSFIVVASISTLYVQMLCMLHGTYFPHFIQVDAAKIGMHVFVIFYVHLVSEGFPRVGL